MGNVSRRDAMRWTVAGAGAALAGLGTTTALQAQAATPAPAPAAPQGAGFYKFKVGDIDAAIVSDGAFFFDKAYPMFGANASEFEVNALLDHAFAPREKVTAHVNTLLIRDGKQVVLVDAGCGNNFGPTTGKAIANLARLGVKPADVTHVVITHVHGDHVGGLLDAEGKPVFANAMHFVPEAEIKFWTGPNPDLSKSTTPPDMQKIMVKIAQSTIAALKGKIEPVAPDKRIIAGVSLVAAPGHTPGHVALSITSGHAHMLYLSDTNHHPALSFEHPEWHFIYDADPVLASKTRRAIFDRAAADKAMVAASHLPFPAIGHVRAKPSGTAFEYVPAIWQWAE